MLVVSISNLSDYSENLKNLKATLIELRVDLMGKEDLLQLSQKKIFFNLPVLLTLKPQFTDFPLFELICQNIDPAYIDIDYSIFNFYEKLIRNNHPKIKLIVSKHTANLFEIRSFYKKYPKADLKKLVIFSEEPLAALKVAKKAQKENLILFVSGENTRFSRFFSSWHYCYISKPTGIGQFSLFHLFENYAITFGVKKFYALIGNPVSKSSSHITHNKLLKALGYDFIYLKFLLKKESFSHSLNLLKSLNCHGLSITTPFKKTILENYRQSFSYTVANTLDVKSNKLINTDILALEEALETAGSKSTILLIGDGCCATGFSHYLKKQGRFFDQWSRKQKIRLKEFYHIIINATSSSKPLEELPKTDLLINLYGFEPYPWIEKNGLEMGARVITAKEFFYLQAMYQFKFWFKDFIRISYEDFFSLVKVPERSVEFDQIKAANNKCLF